MNVAPPRGTMIRMRWAFVLFLVACGDGANPGGDAAAPPDARDQSTADASADGAERDGAPGDAPPVDGGPLDAALPTDARTLRDCRTSADCYPDEWCDLATASYCDYFSLSFCRLRPTSCPAPLPDDSPVCGCDGLVHATACDSYAAGAAVGPGGCAAPAGRYTCGDTFCTPGTQYCAELRETTDSRRRRFECRPMPAHSGPVCPNLLDQICPGEGHPVPPPGPETCVEDVNAGTAQYMCVTVWT